MELLQRKTDTESSMNDTDSSTNDLDSSSIDINLNSSLDTNVYLHRERTNMKYSVSNRDNRDTTKYWIQRRQIRRQIVQKPYQILSNTEDQSTILTDGNSQNRKTSRGLLSDDYTHSIIRTSNVIQSSPSIAHFDSLSSSSDSSSSSISPIDFTSHLPIAPIQKLAKSATFPTQILFLRDHIRTICKYISQIVILLIKYLQSWLCLSISSHLVYIFFPIFNLSYFRYFFCIYLLSLSLQFLLLNIFKSWLCLSIFSPFGIFFLIFNLPYFQYALCI